MGGSDILTPELTDQLDGTADGVRSTLPHVELAGLTKPAGEAWIAACTARFGPAGRESLSGYLAARVLIAAMERAKNPADRESVRAEVFRTSNLQIPIGPLSIAANGDTTNRTVSGYEVVNGQRVFESLVP